MFYIVLKTKMSAILGLFISSSITFIAAYFSNAFGSTKPGNPKQPKSGPCITSDGLNTSFELPSSAGLCLHAPSEYDLIYLNPVSNPLQNSNLTIYQSTPDTSLKLPQSIQAYDASVPGFPTFFNNGVEQTQYFPMLLTRPSVTFGSLDAGLINLNNVSGPILTSVSNGTTGTTNMCPQNFAFNGSTTASDFGTFVSLPLSSVSTRTQQANAWIISGLSSAPQLGSNGTNVPSLFGDPETTVGLASEIYIIARVDCTFYVELTGAYGGNVNLYSNGVDPVSGLPLSVESFQGGQPGTVMGLYTLKQFDVLKVFFGSPGDNSTQWQSPLKFTFDGNAQGGLGTLFGGTNGGGASYAVHYENSKFMHRNADPNLSGFNSGALEAAINNTPGFIPVCVAGGGGGASRNASGGSAGLNNVDPSKGMTYGSPNVLLTTVKKADGTLTIKSTLVSEFGSAGSKLNITGPSLILRSRASNDLSGGGGTINSGGSSNVPSPLSPYSCFGSKLKYFSGQTSTASGSGGGCATATDIGAGGGGGGGGLYGGGAGGWNSQSKPNNLHGAGGGGYSWQGLLKKTATDANVSLNAYRALGWPNVLSEVDLTTYTQYGSLVLGWPKISI